MGSNTHSHAHDVPLPLSGQLVNSGSVNILFITLESVCLLFTYRSGEADHFNACKESAPTPNSPSIHMSELIGNVIHGAYYPIALFWNLEIQSIKQYANTALLFVRKWICKVSNAP